MVAATATVVLAALPRAAASQDAAGTWKVTWAQAVRIARNGSVGVQKWGDATLELRQQGDSVVGTWTTAMEETVHWKVEGTVRDGRLTLAATENDSANPVLAVIRVMRWRGTIQDDHIDGEMTLELRDAARPRAWRPWRADRVGGG